MNEALSSALAGLQGQMRTLELLGSNVANINTIGYKSSRMTFLEALETIPYLIGKSLYWRNIERFLKYFPKENFFFIVFEIDFLKRRKETIFEVQQFLEVRPSELNIDLQSNANWRPRSIFLHSARYQFQRPP